MKDNLSKVKDFYRNKRNRAFVTLGIYIIFFIIVLFIYRTDDNSYKQLTILEKYNLYNKYNYEVKINDINYEGINYYNKTKILYDQNEYYYNRNSDTLALEPIILLTLDLTPQNIYSLIKDKNITSKTDLYEENLTAKTYKINNNEMNNFNKYDLELAEIFITTFENDTNILKVNIKCNNEINIDIKYDVSSYIEENDVMDMGELK